MRGVEGLKDEVSADFEFVAVVQGHDFSGRDLAFDTVPGSEHLLDGFGQVCWDQGGAWLHALEVSLGEVIGQCSGVVHVPVGQADVGAGQSDAGAQTDIEADVKFGHGDGGLLAGNTDT